MNLVFMLEEPSMRYFIAGFIDKIISDGVHVQYLVHEGKQDLDKSIPRKLRGWRTPNSYFVIVRDKDAENGPKLKQRLKILCEDSQRSGVLIRIAVHHLESWVLGDFKAVARAFNNPSLISLEGNRKYRNPDMLANASQEITRLVPGYQKVSGAREVAQFIDPDKNKSPSFNMFILGLKAMIAENHI